MFSTMFSNDDELYDTPGGGIAARKVTVRELPISEEGRAQIVEALRKEIQRLASVERLTPKEFHQIRQLARFGRDAVAEPMPTAGRQLNPIGPAVTLNPGSSPLPTIDMDSETYGAKLIREIVALMPSLLRPRSSPTDIIAAIAQARRDGLLDLEIELRDELHRVLGGAAASVDVEAPKPEAAE